MKKIIGFAAGFLVLAALILPGVMGGQIEQQTVAYFENLYKTTSNQDMSINYDKGWFSSNVTIEIEFPENYLTGILENFEEFEGKDTKLELSFRIDHGPFIFREFSFGLAGISGENSFFLVPPSELKAPLDAIPQFKTTGVIGFDGVVSTVMSVPAFEISLDEFETLRQTNPEATPSILKIDEIRIESEVAAEAGVLNLKIRPFDLKFSMTGQNDQTMEFEMTGLSVNSFYLTDIPYPINYDHGTTTLASLGFRFNQYTFAMENFKSADVITRSADHPLLDVTSKFQFGPIGFHTGEDDTAEPQVQSSTGSIEILNINGTAIVSLVDAAIEMEDEPTEEDKAKLTALVQDIFDAGLEYNIPDLDVFTRWGNVYYTQNMVFPSIDLTGTFDAGSFASTLYYLGNFTFEEAFVAAMVEKTLKQQLEAAGQEVDAATFETIKANTIQQFIIAGYLIREDAGYSMTLELKDGVFTINGTVLDLLGLIESQI